jgi:hypothetical protein
LASVLYRRTHVDVERSAVITDRLMQGIALIFLGAGAVSAANVAVYFDQPFFALGYLVAAVICLLTGIMRVVRAY